MKKTKRVFLSFLMMLAMGIAVIGFRPVKAQAATKSVKNIPYDTVLTNRISKYATVVKKGTTTLKLKANGNGYLRFKVPASKTYTFTFYDQTGDKLGFNNGYAYFLTPVKNRSDKIDLDKLQFSTYGGKTTRSVTKDIPISSFDGEGNPMGQWSRVRSSLGWRRARR